MPNLDENVRNSTKVRHGEQKSLKSEFCVDLYIISCVQMFRIWCARSNVTKMASRTGTKIPPKCLAISICKLDHVIRYEVSTIYLILFCCSNARALCDEGTRGRIDWSVFHALDIGPTTTIMQTSGHQCMRLECVCGEQIEGRGSLVVEQITRKTPTKIL